MLRQSSARLAKPKMVHAYRQWVMDWRVEEEARAAELAAITNSQRLEAEAARAKMAEAEAQQV